MACQRLLSQDPDRDQDHFVKTKTQDICNKTVAQLRGAGGGLNIPQSKSGVPCDSSRIDDFLRG